MLSSVRRRPTRLAVDRLEDRSVASAGALDPTFNGTGYLTQDLGATDRGLVTAVMPDGKVVVGYTDPVTHDNFVLRRYTAAGAADATFGSGGVVVTDLGSSADTLTHLVVAGGKLVAVGQAITSGGLRDIALVRYTDSGALDTTFGKGGKVYTNAVKGFTVCQDTPRAVTVDPAGRVVVAGYSDCTKGSTSASYSVLIRYTSTGALDTTFGGSGIVVGPAGSQWQYAQATSAGVYVLGREASYVAARFTPGGSPDTTFGTNGKKVLGFNLPANSATVPRQFVAISPDASTFTTLAYQVPAPGGAGYDILLNRYLADGTPDARFGSGGQAWLSLDAAVGQAVTEYGEVVADGQGRLLVAGEAQGTASADEIPFVARFTADGTLDPAWGSGGVTTLGLNPGAVNVLTLQPNGGVVGTGRYNSGTTSSYSTMFVARFQGDTSLLTAAAAAPARAAATITAADAQALFDEAVRRWASTGADVSALAGVEVHVADLGGDTLGLATAGGIWVDDDAAGWGWFVDPTPWDDSEFTTPGNQGEMNRMDLLSVLVHEAGHLLGHDHDEGGVMAETLAPGERPGAAAFAPPGDENPSDAPPGRRGKA